MPPKELKIIQEPDQGNQPLPTGLLHPLDENPFKHSRFSQRLNNPTPLAGCETLYEDSDAGPGASVDDENLLFPTKELPQDLKLNWYVVNDTSDIDWNIESLVVPEDGEDMEYTSVYAIWIDRKARKSNVIAYRESTAELRKTRCGLTFNPHVAKACFQAAGFIVQYSALPFGNEQASATDIRKYYMDYTDVAEPAEGPGNRFGGDWVNLWGLECNEVVLRWLILKEIWQELPQELQDYVIYLNFVGEPSKRAKPGQKEVAIIRGPYAPGELTTPDLSASPHLSACSVRDHLMKQTADLSRRHLSIPPRIQQALELPWRLLRTSHPIEKSRIFSRGLQLNPTLENAAVTRLLMDEFVSFWRVCCEELSDFGRRQWTKQILV